MTKEKKMKQKIQRVKRWPHLYVREYETAAGDKREKYYGIFTCKLRRKRRCFPLGGDLDAAKEALALLLADNVKGDGRDFDAELVQGMTLFPWTERFMQVKASKRSLDKDKVSCRRLKEFFGDCALDSIVTSKIEAYKQKRLTEKTKQGRAPKPATINRELSCLHTMLTLAARDRILERVPYVEQFEEHNQREKIASEEEFTALLDASPDHLQEILLCLWDTGMRKREALKLTWDRVDFKNDLIKLGALAKDGQIDTKSKYARVIPISPRLKDLLIGIWQREKAGKVRRMSDRVFLYRGKPIDRFDKAFATACEKAEIEQGGAEGLWIHDIRATFATRKIAAGFDRDWVKMITGHKTDHVFRRYNRPSIESLKKVVSGDKVSTPVIQAANNESAQAAN
jgi:integrase